MLIPETFKCDRTCGKCCIDYTVLLSKADIRRIKNLGYEEDYFIAYERIGPEAGKPILTKKPNNWCVFFGRNKAGIYSCSIYGNRPEICKDYPFFGRPIESCIPVNSFIKIRK